MKPSSAALRAILTSRQFYVADLYTWNLFGGGTLTYTGGDKDITANGVLYTCGAAKGPYFDRQSSRAMYHQKIGLQVDTLSLDVIPGAALLFGLPFLQEVHQGLFDQADFRLDRAFMPTYGDTRAGVINLFSGCVTEADAGRTVANFSVASHTEKLNLSFPRNLYQAGCLNNLADNACGVTLASFSSSKTTTSGSTNTLINVNISGAAGYYDQGKVRYTSGVNNGLQRGIRAVAYGTPGQILLVGPLPAPPAAGDTFVVSAGCDKSWAGTNGCPKFSNTARFRGFPFVPQPATAL